MPRTHKRQTKKPAVDNRTN